MPSPSQRAHEQRRQMQERAHEQMRQMQERAQKNQRGMIQQGINDRRHRQQEGLRRQMDDTRKRQMERIRKSGDQGSQKQHQTWMQGQREGYAVPVRPRISLSEWSDLPVGSGTIEAENHPVRGTFVLLLCVALTIAFGLFVGNMFNSLFPAVVTWMVGVTFSYLLTKRAWGNE